MLIVSLIGLVMRHFAYDCKKYLPTKVFSKGKDPSAISHSLQLVEIALRDDTGFLSLAATAPPEGYKPSAQITPAEKIFKVEKDLLNDVAALLRDLEATKEPSIYWLQTANNLANALQTSRFCDEALFLRRTLHPLLHKLYLQHGEVYASDLAVSYHNLSSTLSRKKKHGEALTAMQSSLDIRRQLAQKDHVFIPAFASSMHGIGYCLSRVNRYKEAVYFLQDAIDTWLKLTEQDSVTYQANLARSYQMLGFCISESGRLRDCIRPYQQAVTAAREASKGGPSAASILASSLHDLAFYLMRLGKPGDALPFIQEAVGIYRELKKDSPPTYKSSTRRAVNLLRTCQFGGKCVDACQSLKKHLRLSSRSTAVDEA